jgi:hypothetical protein
MRARVRVRVDLSASMRVCNESVASERVATLQPCFRQSVCQCARLHTPLWQVEVDHFVYFLAHAHVTLFLLRRYGVKSQPYVGFS